MVRFRARREVARFTSWHPMAVWPLASALHVLFISYAVGCLFPPADSPTKENGEWRSLRDADLTPAPLQRLQAVTPFCWRTFILLLKTQLLANKSKKKTKKLQEQSNLLDKRVLSVSSLFLILVPPHLTDAPALVDSRYWKCRVSQQPAGLCDF